MSKEWKLGSRFFFRLVLVFSFLRVLALLADVLSLPFIRGIMDRILLVVKHLRVVQVLLLDSHQSQVR